MLIETNKLRELLAVNKGYGEKAEEANACFEGALSVVERVARSTGLVESRAPVVLVYNGGSLLSREEIMAAHKFAAKK